MGRNKLPKGEIKKPIVVLVKSKYYDKAKRQITEIAGKFNSEQYYIEIEAKRLAGVENNTV